jgi:3-deoxy-manno-octulosonate cytidylyltransferase (CMP-KDO synthetase)
MSVIGVIPARLDSERFPRKILTPINGKPMVMCVAERAMNSSLLDEVIIAVDSEEVYKEIKKSNVKVVMTAKDHLSGSDRIAEVVENRDVDIVVNIQGDEPMLDPKIIDGLVNEFDDSSISMTTAVSTDISPKDFFNSNIVKVLLDENRDAIGFRRDLFQEKIGGWYRHVGLYAYRKDTLLKFAGLPTSENEKKFHLEQLRALDNGIPIRAVITDYPYRGVDVEEDLNVIIKMNKHNKT